jgi:phosphoenolpyruvate-protein kinase (PTS system EI component)
VTAATSRARHYAGLTASQGSAAGVIYQADTAVSAIAATPDQVEAAFAAVAAERQALAGRLRESGRADEADIVAVAALIAADPVLAGAAVAAVSDGADAAAAVQQAAASQAAVIAAIPDPAMAERAGDVRQVAVAVLEHLAGAKAARPGRDFILVRRDLAAADLIELVDAGLVGAASVTGGASSHAAIVARGLGVPMITAVDPAALTEPTGSLAILSADAGELTVDADPAQWLAVARTTISSDNASPRAGSGPAGRPLTTDGEEVLILCNTASATETRRGLAAGAAGVGLLRSEIPFTSWYAWPTESEHLAQLTPILELLDGRLATVRLLDFSGDKIPPFLQVGWPGPAGSAAGAGSAGLAALLAHPTALRRQLRAVLAAGRSARLAILIPMVSAEAEIASVRETLRTAADEMGTDCPSLGIMVELRSTAAAAGKFAHAVDFFSIGTNDLTGEVLGLHRLSLSARPGLAADPRVLALIENVVSSAAAAGIPVSVCGDAAADTVVLPLLIGIGVRTVSVPAAQVARVRDLIAVLDADACAAVAAKSVRAATLDEVEELVSHALGR